MRPEKGQVLEERSRY